MQEYYEDLGPISRTNRVKNFIYFIFYLYYIIFILYSTYIRFANVEMDIFIIYEYLDKLGEKNTKNIFRGWIGA